MLMRRAQLRRRDDGMGPPRVVAPHQKPGAVSEFQEFHYLVVASRLAEQCSSLLGCFSSCSHQVHEPILVLVESEKMTAGFKNMFAEESNTVLQQTEQGNIPLNNPAARR